MRQPRTVLCLIRRQSGFSLIELSIVMIVMAIMAGGMLMTIVAQRDNGLAQDNAKTLSTIQEALLGYAVAHGRLPCPDDALTGTADTDGQEDLSSPAQLNTPLAGQTTQVYVCPQYEGFLPYETLGVPKVDAWGSRFRYRVTPAFTQGTIVTTTATGVVVSSSNLFSLASLPTLSIRERNTSTKASQGIANNVVAVVISHGKNQLGGFSTDNAAFASAPAGSDEATNATLGDSKFSRLPTPNPNATCSESDIALPYCEFDDQLVWIADSILFNRMNTAGKFLNPQ
jgi:prepilin-type N-terminal cleavage/methylation domain-containing protein